MAETVLLPTSGFAGHAQPGRYGRLGQWTQPVFFQERLGVKLVQIAGLSGQDEAIAEKLRQVTGLTLPKGPHRTGEGGLGLLGLGPSQWLVMAGTDAAHKDLEHLTTVLEGLAAVADLSSAKAILRISGLAARDVLAKGCALDLNPGAFGLDDTARTAIALIPCQLWQVDVSPTYDIAVDTSYAASFWGWITASAAEFGYEVGEAASD